MSEEGWGPDDIARIKNVIESGVKIQTEIKDLREGLSETIKEVADQCNISSKALRRAIKIASDGTDALESERDFMKEVEDALAAAGKV